jgi:hypothetical protein
VLGEAGFKVGDALLQLRDPWCRTVAHSSECGITQMKRSAP